MVHCLQWFISDNLPWTAVFEEILFCLWRWYYSQPLSTGNIATANVSCCTRTLIRTVLLTLSEGCWKWTEINTKIFHSIAPMSTRLALTADYMVSSFPKRLKLASQPSNSMIIVRSLWSNLNVVLPFSTMF